MRYLIATAMLLALSLPASAQWGYGGGCPYGYRWDDYQENCVPAGVPFVGPGYVRPGFGGGFGHEFHGGGNFHGGEFHGGMHGGFGGGGHHR